MTTQAKTCTSFESSDLCTKCGEARRWHTDTATDPKPYGYSGEATTIALPSQWECAYGPFDDQPFCAETEDEGHKCPTIRVHSADAEAFSNLVDEVHNLKVALDGTTSPVDPWQRAVDGLNALVDAGITFDTVLDGAITSAGTGRDEVIEFDETTKRWILTREGSDR